MSSSNSSREVVADAGPIIALARLDLLALPARIFDRACVTNIVADECMVNPQHPEHCAIRKALEAGHLQRVEWSQLPAPAMWNLDPGEASTIALAEASSATVLVDDRAARRASRSIGLSVIGTCGLLLVARRRGLIEAVRPLLETLTESGYYLSRPLIESICRLAGES